jgi:hypothetical protein
VSLAAQLLAIVLAPLDEEERGELIARAHIEHRLKTCPTGKKDELLAELLASSFAGEMLEEKD